MARSRQIVSLLGLTAACMLLCFGGCLFSPRDPGTPENPDPSVWISPTEPEFVLANITEAFSYNRMTNYGRSFHETEVEMIFDPSDETSGDISEFMPWDGVQEEARMDAIIPEHLPTIEVTWEIPDDINEESSSIWWYENLGYRLVFVDGSKQVVYEGECDLYFINEDGLWVINRWHDRRKADGENNTWGYLRLKNVIEWP